MTTLTIQKDFFIFQQSLAKGANNYRAGGIIIICQPDICSEFPSIKTPLFLYPVNEARCSFILFIKLLHADWWIQFWLLSNIPRRSLSSLYCNVSIHLSLVNAIFRWLGSLSARQCAWNWTCVGFVSGEIWLSKSRLTRVSISARWWRMASGPAAYFTPLLLYSRIVLLVKSIHLVFLHSQTVTLLILQYLKTRIRL